jgi:acyl carrier protein
MASTEVSTVSDNLTEKVLELIADTKRVPRESLGIDTTFEQLEMDSLDALNLVYAIEEHFNISVPDSTIRSIKSVRDLTEHLRQILAASVTAQNSAS